MKKFFLALLVMIITMDMNAQTAVDARPDVLLLKETSFDFGKIPQGKPVTHAFEIVNTGKAPLYIENIQASCGCTTPEWTKDPVPPGGSKIVKVGYNAAAFGKFEKPVTIYYEGGKIKQVYIKGEVWQAPADIAPANASIQLLKNTNN